MSSRNKLKYLFILTILIGTGFAMADALGAFNTKPYHVVFHGAMRHYVPNNRDPNVKIERFPTRPPGPDEMITSTGQIVKKEEWVQQQKSSSAKDKNGTNQKIISNEDSTGH